MMLELSGEKIVTIGGGTGSYMVLRGLKNFPLISRLWLPYSTMAAPLERFEMSSDFASGDLRRCLIALSEGKRRAVPETSLISDLIKRKFAPRAQFRQSFSAGAFHYLWR